MSLPASVLHPLHTGGSQICVSRRVATTNNSRSLRLCISMLFHPLPYETSYTIFLALVMLSCSWIFVYTGPPPGNVLSPLTSLAGLWFAIRSRVPLVTREHVWWSSHAVFLCFSHQIICCTVLPQPIWGCSVNQFLSFVIIVAISAFVFFFSPIQSLRHVTRFWRVSVDWQNLKF